MTELAAQYVTQVSNDLAANCEQQERLTAEIAALQERLVLVRRDHSVLVAIQHALDGTPTTAKAGRTPGAALLSEPPRPRPVVPTLGELVLDVLRERPVQASAGQIAAAVNEADPGRQVKTTVARNTLEILVGRKQVRRTKQGISVLYAIAATEQPSIG
ncbi:hypothetical protein [Streptomyces sp. NPDC005498]|uniref:hypothetical protein n=1 Tax=Streptomyces sp. NPDC005498 TaxID=3364717 RepID=UPI003679C459